MSIAEIEKKTTLYAAERQALSARVQSLQDAMEKLRKEHMPKIRQLVGKCAERHADVKALIEANPDLFVKPKTLVFAGIKVGYKKGGGSMEWEDDAQVVKLIKKHLPDQADLLIKTKETPSKEALENLDGSDLKKLGVTLVDAGERVFIKPTDSAVDKVLKALLADAEEDTDEQRAAA